MPRAICNRTNVLDWERFRLERLSENTIAIKALVKLKTKYFDGYYLCADNGGGGRLDADRREVKEWETWTILRNKDSSYSFITVSGKHFLTADNSGGGEVNVRAQSNNDWTRFRLILMEDGLYGIQAYSGHFLCVEP